MLHDKRVLVVVPARGGSRGVPLKNIHPLNGRPLIAYTGDIVKALPWVDFAVCSTDHDEIAWQATRSGLTAIMRTPELSGDLVGDLEVLTHAVNMAGGKFDIIVMLQPTCPLRKPHHVEWAVHKLYDENLDAVWTVSPVDLKYHAYKQLSMHDHRITYQFLAGRNIIARQQLKQTYMRNGAAYAFTHGCLFVYKDIMPPKCGAVIIKEPLISIDTIGDFAACEVIMRERLYIGDTA